MSSKVFTSLFLSVLLIAGFSINAYAWGDEGHRITVRIAAEYLNAEARTEVIKLIKVDAANNELYYKKTCPEVAALVRKKTLSEMEEIKLLSDGLACVASWADPPVKNQRQYTSNWHFVDIPVIFATSPSPPFRFNYDAARDCRMDPEQGDCALQALERIQPILKNYKDTGDKDHEYGEELATRADSLKFYVHIIGDIHQPLHCVADKKDKEAVENPKDLGDMGGNLKYATWFGEDVTPYGLMNLHSIWDGGFITRTMKTNNWTIEQYAKKLFEEIPKDNAKLSQMQSQNFPAWIAESYNLAVTNAYKKLPKLDTNCKMAFTDPKTQKTRTANNCYQLGEDYYKSNHSIVEQQLKSGGVRLAGKLNCVFNRKCEF